MSRRLTRIEVGKPHPTIKPPTGTITEFLWSTAGMELRLFYQAPQAEEIDAVRRGEADFAAAYHDDLIYFLFRFGDIPWSEAVYSQWLIPSDYHLMHLPALTPESRYLMTVCLVDADTAIVRALRAITLSHALSVAMRDMYLQQLRTLPIDVDEYMARARAMQARFPTVEAMLFDPATQH